MEVEEEAESRKKLDEQRKRLQRQLRDVERSLIRRRKLKVASKSNCNREHQRVQKRSQKIQGIEG